MHAINQLILDPHWTLLLCYTQKTEHKEAAEVQKLKYDFTKYDKYAFEKYDVFENTAFL